VDGSRDEQQLVLDNERIIYLCKFLFLAVVVEYRDHRSPFSRQHAARHRLEQKLFRQFSHV